MNTAVSTAIDLQATSLSIKTDKQKSQLASMAKLLGAENVLTSQADRYAYCRDRLPFALYKLRAQQLPATLPMAIAMPGTAQEIEQLIKFTRAEKICVIPFGAGSGVLGGTIPLVGELMVDLKRLNKLIAINPIDSTATVQAGMNGWQFEEALRAQGFTAGHLPQSITMSTVGGWAACRGAGQASSRYGKIEDIVVGLKAVLPDGQLLEVRPLSRRAVGPSVKDMLVGSEGVLGLITELTVRIWRLPEFSSAVVMAFPDIEHGFGACREIMQAELRPEVVRLYDSKESAQRTEGIPEFSKRPILCIMKFSGKQALAQVERQLALEICAKHDAVTTDNAPYQHWEETRFHSYSTQWQTDGYFMDTVEITGNWSKLSAMYKAMHQAVHAIHPDIHFGAHWSHVYAEGACQYMTIRFPPMAQDLALKLHKKAWDTIESICLDMQGSISHHHGAGLFRGPWMRRELNRGLDMIQILKDGLDPDNLMNPGKLGLRQPSGSTWKTDI
jgi:alkyldihydroxyacetonephosphate synthase